MIVLKENLPKKQIVMFGGSFNPPLNSHFLLAQQIINEYSEIEKILFMPVNSKYQKADLISNMHRYEMLKLVCNKNEKFEVSKLEIESSRPLYTIETLTKLQKEYLEYEIAFIIGSDNLKQIDTWKTPEKLVQNFKIYVLQRAEDNIEEIIQNNKFLKKYEQAFIKVENKIKTNLSSTFVRESIKNGKSIKYLAPEEVISYIEKNKLYK